MKLRTSPATSPTRWRSPAAPGGVPSPPAEQAGLRAFYRTSRTTGKLSHDAAPSARLLARVLMSPAFLYRVEAAPRGTEITLERLGDGQPPELLPVVLDSGRRAAPARPPRRSCSDSEEAGGAGRADDRRSEGAAAVHRVLRPVARLLPLRPVPRRRHRRASPSSRTRCSRAMYEESVATFEYLVRERRPVKEILHADYTFLNKPLAKFYGIDEKLAPNDTLQKVEGASKFDRGGALRLGSVLTTTSAPLRTSPVKRGDWILRRILSTPTPPPPADAGTLPADDKSFEGQTLRQRLTAHKRDAKCAACHLRIDPLGFPLEGFDAVGRARTAYNDGKPVDITGEFRDKTTIVGADGLLGYLQKQDQQGADHAVAQDDRLRAGPQPAGVRSAPDRRDGEGRRRRHRSPTSRPASSPAASSAIAPAAPTCRPRSCRRTGRNRRRLQGPRTTHEPSPPSFPRQLPASLPARRRRRPGAAVAGVDAAAGAGRRRAGRCWRRGQGRRGSAAAPRHRVLLERRRAGALVGEGQRRDDGARPRPDADAAAPRGHGLHPRASTASRRWPRPARTSAA